MRRRESERRKPISRARGRSMNIEFSRAMRVIVRRMMGVRWERRSVCPDDTGKTSV